MGLFTKEQEKKKDFDFGDLFFNIVKYFIKITLGNVSRFFEIHKVVISEYTPWERKKFYFLMPILWGVCYFLATSNFITGLFGGNNGNSVLFGLVFMYYIGFGIPLKLLKGESILPVYTGSMKQDFETITEEDKIYYIWLQDNKDKLDKLVKAIYEIFRINGLLLKGNTEEDTKYILMSGKPKVLDLKNNEIEIKYILPNGLPFTKVDNPAVKQSILQAWQKYFTNIGNIELSIKGDVFSIKGKKEGFDADFSETYKFPNLFQKSYFENPLDFEIGIDESGESKTYDLGKMPHLLVASETMGGKSVAMTDILVSLMKNVINGAKIDFIIIDPKQVEFMIYKNIPGFIVESSFDKSIQILKKLVEEMERRYTLLMENGVKNLKSLHDKGIGLDLSYKVLIVDEFADIMLDKDSKDDFNWAIQKLAQKGRASGIHLILATQSPSADVVNTQIKANLPARIGLKTSDVYKSRTIIDSDELASIQYKGEAFIKTNKLEHIKTYFISDDELSKFNDYYKKSLRKNTEVEHEVKNDLVSPDMIFKDKYDLLFEKIKNEKTFKISWKEILKNDFSEIQLREFSKIFQEEKILEKLPNKSLILVNENGLNETLKNRLQNI